MLTHRGFSAWIVAEGTPLPEYLVAVDATANRVSCWIPSKEGQAFTVYWRDHGGKVDTCAFITLDGFVVPGRFLYGEGVASRQGVRASRTTERPFVFKQVKETDGEPSTPSGSKEVGMITLRVKRVKRVRGKAANNLQPLPSSRGKRKAGELCIGFGDEQPVFDQSPTTWDVLPYDPDVPGSQQPSTYVSFVFRYRTREFLESQGIAPETEKMSAVPTPTIPRQPPPMRRVASLPISVHTSLPSPSPPKKRQTLMPTFMRIGSQRMRRPSTELRRTVSWKALTTKPQGIPGEGLLLFKSSVSEGSPDTVSDSLPDQNGSGNESMTDVSSTSDG